MRSRPSSSMSMPAAAATSAASGPPNATGITMRRAGAVGRWRCSSDSTSPATAPTSVERGSMTTRTVRRPPTTSRTPCHPASSMASARPVCRRSVRRSDQKPYIANGPDRIRQSRDLAPSYAARSRPWSRSCCRRRNPDRGGLEGAADGPGDGYRSRRVAVHAEGVGLERDGRAVARHHDALADDRYGTRRAAWSAWAITAPASARGTSAPLLR